MTFGVIIEHKQGKVIAIDSRVSFDGVKPPEDTASKVYSKSKEEAIVIYGGIYINFVKVHDILDAYYQTNTHFDINIFKTFLLDNIDKSLGGEPPKNRVKRLANEFKEIFDLCYTRIYKEINSFYLDLPQQEKQIKATYDSIKKTMQDLERHHYHRPDKRVSLPVQHTQEARTIVFEYAKKVIDSYPIIKLMDNDLRELTTKYFKIAFCHYAQEYISNKCVNLVHVTRNKTENWIIDGVIPGWVRTWNYNLDYQEPEKTTKVLLLALSNDAARQVTGYSQRDLLAVNKEIEEEKIKAFFHTPELKGVYNDMPQSMKDNLKSISYEPTSEILARQKEKDKMLQDAENKYLEFIETIKDMPFEDVCQRAERFVKDTSSVMYLRHGVNSPVGGDVKTFIL